MAITNVGVALVFLGAALATARADEGFVDHGVGAKVAELRGLVTTVTKDGRHLAIATTLDEGPRGYILATDIDTGKTTQHFCPPGVRQSAFFGALMSRSGKFYATQGKVFVEFDPDLGRWTFHGKPSDHVSAYLTFTEGPDGTVWTGGAYRTALISFDPKTRQLRDHGILDPKEHYLSSLAVDKAGWVYAGIGTARCNIVAHNPATGDTRQLMPEADRVHGSGSVYPTTDGAAFGRAGKHSFRLFEGKATPLDRSKAPPRLAVGNIGYGGRLTTFPDGRRITAYDIDGRTLEVLDPKTKRTRTIAFDYDTEGAMLTSLAEGPKGIVYVSSCHPMHLVALDPATPKLWDHGAIPKVGGGNFCAMARAGNLLIGAEYAGGRLWAYDVTQPWRPARGREVVGIPAAELVKKGTCTDGHFTYLAGHDVAFLKGDKFGAEGTFTLTVPAAGRYFLHILPYTSAAYCTVQFLFDGKPVGEPFVAKSPTSKPGPLLVHGPFDLKTGDHRLTLRTLETKGQKPWCSIVSADLSPHKRDSLVVVRPSNPRVLAQWKRDICRPRTALAHPDGRHVMMAGFAGYGLCGGGIGIVDLQTNKPTLLAHEQVLPNQSCITLKALPNGDLVGGTSIDAPGGGHVSAKEAELFILDWKTRKVVFRTVPVPGDRNIVSIHVPPDGLVYGLSSNRTFFVFDPKARKLVHKESFARYGGVPRHALQRGPHGKLYAMLGGAILRIEPDTFEHTLLARPPKPITAGGALVGGRLAYASRSHVWTYRVPGLDSK